MAFAVAVLLSITLVIAVVLALVGGFLGVALLGWVHRGAEAAAGLPRLSTVAPVSPLSIAIVATVAAVALVQGWPHVRARTDEEYLLPPTTSISASVTASLLGALYLVLVEGGAALLAGLSTLVGIAAAIGLGVVLAIAVTVGEVRGRIDSLREEVVAGSTPIADVTMGVEAVAMRLAQQVGVPVPEVRLTSTDRPESLTVGSGEDAVVVVSRGLLETLTDEELESVLAHDVSHLANGDSRVLGAALAPVLTADEWIDADPDRPGEYVWNWIFGGAETVRPIRRRSARPWAGVVR